MATASARTHVRDNPKLVTAILTILGYGLVIGTFRGLVPIYPDIGLDAVNFLTDAIAVVNSAATISLVLGWRWIRRDEIEKHRYAMLTAFTLILVFLVLYLLKVGGGGEKYFVGPDGVYYAYLVMLFVHIALSVVAVPLVLYALVLGLTHTPTELRDTSHARIGRYAAASWIVSLALGVVTYVLLNHVYDWRFEEITTTVTPILF